MLRALSILLVLHLGWTLSGAELELGKVSVISHGFITGQPESHEIRTQFPTVGYHRVNLEIAFPEEPSALELPPEVSTVGLTVLGSSFGHPAFWFDAPLGTDFTQDRISDGLFGRLPFFGGAEPVIISDLVRTKSVDEGWSPFQDGWTFHMGLTTPAFRSADEIITPPGIGWAKFRVTGRAGLSSDFSRLVVLPAELEVLESVIAYEATGIIIGTTTTLPNVNADCDGSGALDVDDLSCIETVADRDRVLAALMTLPGDLDGDGEVSFDDFLSLSTNYGDPTKLKYTDGNIDLEADGPSFGDFVTLSANYSEATGGAAAVPEPVSSAMLIMCCSLVAWIRSREGVR